MCIENNKCLNLIRLRIAVILIAHSALIEGVLYFFLNRMIMITFPFLDLALFGIWIAILRHNASLKNITALIYLSIAVIQLGCWVILMRETFYTEFEGRKLCEGGSTDEDGNWVLDGQSYSSLLDCNAEIDMLLAFDYLVMLVIIFAKVFFAKVIWHWTNLKSDPPQQTPASGEQNPDALSNELKARKSF